MVGIAYTRLDEISIMDPAGQKLCLGHTHLDVTAPHGVGSLCGQSSKGYIGTTAGFFSLIKSKGNFLGFTYVQQGLTGTVIFSRSSMEHWTIISQFFGQIQ